MAGPENRFERAQLLSAAFDPIIDICVLLGVHTAELETMLRVEFVKRLAATLPRNVKTGKEPSHEEVGLAAGLNRGEVQNIRSSGAKSAQLRMRKKSAQHSKSDRVLDLWKSNPTFMTTSGGPLNLPIDKQHVGPSFEDLVAEALPGKRHANVLKDLRRRGLVQVLPDEIVRIRRAARALPTELNESSIAFIGEQMRIVGSALLQSIVNAERAAGSLNMVATSDIVSIPEESIASARATLHESIANFVQGFEKDFARKGKKGKGSQVLLGTTVYTFSNK
ncbi:MAG TPA: hypothetical protein VGD63_11720 [Steroidobacteraceae bacterium]